MLEFEDSKNMSIKPVEGTVVMSISEYNALLHRAEAADNAIRLCRRDYTSTRPIEIEIDKHWLHQLAKAKLFEQYSVEALSKYKIVDGADDLIVLDVAIAHLHEPVRKGTV